MVQAFALCLCFLPVALGAAGGRVVVSQKFPDYAVGKVVTLLESAVKQLSIPDVSGESDGFEYKVNHFKINSLSCTNPSLKFVEGVGFALGLEAIDLQAKADWSYKLHSWPHLPFGSGSVDVKSGSNSHARATLKVVVTNERPQFEIQSLDVNIGSYGITVHGSLLSWLYNIILHSWSDHIKGAIDSAVTGALKDEVQILNKAIAKYSFTEKLPFPAPYDKTAIDFSIINIQALTDRIVADDHAEMYPTDGHPRFNGTAPSIPMTNFTQHQIKLELSSYLFDTAFYTFTSQDLLQYTVTNELIPKESPISLTTAAFSVFAPGLDKYPGKTMNISASTLPRSKDDPHSIDFQNGVINAILPGSFAFNVMNSSLSEAAFTLTCPLAVSATLDVKGTGKNQSLSINVASATCTPLAVASSSVGKVRAEGWISIETAVKAAVAIIRPMVNKYLNAGFALPSVGAVSLTNTTTVSDGGKIEIQTDFEFDFGIAAAPVYTWPLGFSNGALFAHEQPRSTTDMFV